MIFAWRFAFLWSLTCSFMVRVYIPSTMCGHTRNKTERGSPLYTNLRITYRHVFLGCDRIEICSLKLSLLFCRGTAPVSKPDSSFSITATLSDLCLFRVDAHLHGAYFLWYKTRQRHILSSEVHIDCPHSPFVNTVRCQGVVR